MRRPLVFLVFVLAALAPMTAMASEWYRCRSTGEAQQVCCCPKAAEEPPAEQIQLQRACCCDVEVMEAPAADPRSTTNATAFAAMIPPVVTTVSAAPPRVAVRIATVPVALQSRGPPALYVQHCSLLL